MAAKKKAFDFERALGELEQVVTAMEAGNMPLEESLKAFEKGVRLTRECQQALQEAEQKVEVLLKSDEGIETKPFVDTEDDTYDA
ncbi:exodeoxyribonuclease VII small subunit [Saccharophagus sp. K07]|jgi:exodeoxyribonuclease VII small subunit|uniref:exodeoxyribonuclease VII small subunit n=1 Tax=Saccharophagus sp. K07 TaxID=2283636 RepID=UPI0016520EB2|nr:exodeoxyribonuclease VII small subunit [Saccharophagus sp. K07]MBC6903926.1 exodeoxyribonuclease VII small subunit [Saccharophagus sp. K07]